MSAWVDQIFSAAAANGGVVRRARSDVNKYASLAEVIAEAKAKGFHVIETGDQIVVLCHAGALVIHT
ncbi:MAG: hypothetical protein EOO54_01840 [Haliea sp.]|nr:MAG: hypothetical protein EOO54_01840 [Haliea sp.]